MVGGLEARRRGEGKDGTRGGDYRFHIEMGCRQCLACLDPYRCALGIEVQCTPLTTRATLRVKRGRHGGSKAMLLLA